MARAGARVIIDDVFLAGAASQERTRAQLAGLSVLWVGVRCHPVVAAERAGPGATARRAQPARQATIVQGVTYDLEVGPTTAWRLHAPPRSSAHRER